MNPVVQFIEAARFLTRISLPPPKQKPVILSDAFLMFPVVGVLIGAFTGLLLWAGTALGLSPYLAAVIAVGGTISLTGGLHEDGLGDLADGLGGGKTAATKLKIMRDSRVGSYGVLCLVLNVAAKLGAYSTLIFKLTSPIVLCVLIACAVVSRGAMIGVVTHLPPARKDGLAATLTPRLWHSIFVYILTLTLTVAALVPVLSVSGIFITLCTVIVVTVVLATFTFRQIGGHTGDVAGAVQQLAEIACLFSVVALV